MIKAIVTDIEGTTSSISFVKDVLFPYARQHLPEFIRLHQQEPEVVKQLQAACDEAGIAYDLEAIIGRLVIWIDEDQKITPLKALQGLIWEHGYAQGDFTGHIYPDALTALQNWHSQGYALYVYSSGSVHAQKLLFGHTEAGDLTSLFSGFFDTQIGGKKETASYLRIVELLGLTADEVLFLSDIQEELDAAKSAGLKTVWLVREQAPNAAEAHVQASCFSEIKFI